MLSPFRNGAAIPVKALVLLLAGVLLMWSQPWSQATATPRFSSKPEAGRSVSSARCQSGYRKSTVTGRCVRNGVRFPMLGWN